MRTRRLQASSRPLEIAPLTPSARQRYARAWWETQSRFVHDPGSAVSEADRLIEQVLVECGYPVEELDEQAADESLGRPDVVEDYRVAHEIALAHERGHADAEDLRRAIVRYRSLFERLVETDEATARA
jgi:hypothetical protein